MRALLQRIGGLAAARRGVTAMEYGLLAGLIGLAIVVSINAFSAAVIGVFNTLIAAFP